ncbi:hypothetical protein [Laspinema palackyanum]|uniref:hypothetical protein n=1 Tax=Laspinema palackyanum TaxID=3231601 RepID=UPI00345D8BBC|nr:hypothetical protein [Laspinema sp. D2c]
MTIPCLVQAFYPRTQNSPPAIAIQPIVASDTPIPRCHPRVFCPNPKKAIATAPECF